LSKFRPKIFLTYKNNYEYLAPDQIKKTNINIWSQKKKKKKKNFPLTVKKKKKKKFPSLKKLVSLLKEKTIIILVFNQKYIT